MFVIVDNNGELVTFTRDEKKAQRFAMKYAGEYKKIRA